jgi:hypothetical protein
MGRAGSEFIFGGNQSMLARSAWSVFQPGAMMAAVAGLHLSLCVGAAAQAPARTPTRIAPPDDFGLQFDRPQPKPLDAQTDSTVRSATARTQFAVDGTGLTIAVLDTGLRTTHVDFAGKVLAVRNFTTDDGSNPNVVTDGNGHGTNVAGVAIGNGLHVGIAPGAKVIPLKVLNNTGGGSFSSIYSALDWVIANKDAYGISVVNLSLGDGGNYTSDPGTSDAVRSRLITLRNAKVATCIAAGNSFYNYASKQGMAYPGIIRESISVGALYDANIGSIYYGSGAAAYSTAPKVFCPFSQRLHSTTNAYTKTDVWVPGAALTAAGNANDTAESTYHGTSQATPVTAGLCLLAQQYAKSKTGQLPTVDQLEKWLVATTTSTGNTLTDGDDENDNVTNTGKQFVMADAVEMLTAANTELSGGGGGGGSKSAITASYSASTKTLTVTGDANAGALTISRSGSKITLSAGANTTINGVTKVTITISGSFTLKGDLGAGNDQLSLNSLSLTLLDMKLGDGNDSAYLNYDYVTTCKVDGGAGTDKFISTTSTIVSNQNTNIP